VFVVALCRITAFNDYHVFGTWLGSGHFPIGPVFLFIFLTLFVNTILRAQKPDWQLTPAELMVIWAMLIVTAGMPDASIARYLFPTMLGVTYFATPENEWQELFHQYIPDWLIVRDKQAANSFYEGISAGDPIPWMAWVKPLSFWIPFFLMLWTIMICLSAILRKQWAERERLGFPLVQLPVEMAQSPEDKRLLNAFFRNRMMWIGFAIPVFLHTINALHFYHPTVPEIRLRHYLDRYFYEHPINHIRPFWLHILPSVIGISYLISLEVSFSLWFFFILYKVEYVTAAALGYASATYYRGFVPHREMGAYVALVGFFIWMGKAHFWHVLKAAFSAPKQVDDTNEVLPYRYATWGLFASIMGATLMLTYAGASFLPILVVIIMLIVMWLVLSRLVVEGGMLYVQHSFVADNLIMTAIGSSRLDAPTLTILAFIPAVGMRDLRELMMPHILNAFKIPEFVKMNPPPTPSQEGMNYRRLMLAIAIAIIIGVAVTAYSHIRLMFTVGASGMDWWTHMSAPRHFFNRLAYYLQYPTTTDWTKVTFVIAGAGFMSLMLFMRRTFIWWNLHPLGFVMPTVWFMYNIWFSIFIGWLAKFIILKQGGLRQYRNMRPFFLGLALGEGFIGGILAIISWFVGRGYNFLPT